MPPYAHASTLELFISRADFTLVDYMLRLWRPDAIMNLRSVNNRLRNYMEYFTGPLWDVDNFFDRFFPPNLFRYTLATSDALVVGPSALSFFDGGSDNVWTLDVSIRLRGLVKMAVFLERSGYSPVNWAGRPVNYRDIVDILRTTRRWQMISGEYSSHSVLETISFVRFIMVDQDVAGVQTVHLHVVASDPMRFVLALPSEYWFIIC